MVYMALGENCSSIGPIVCEYCFSSFRGNISSILGPRNPSLERPWFYSRQEGFPNVSIFEEQKKHGSDNKPEGASYNDLMRWFAWDIVCLEQRDRFRT